MTQIDNQKVETLVNDNEAVMIYFYNDHCAPCISLRPKVQKLLEEQFEKMKFLLVNSEINPKVTSHFGVFANPTIILFFDGKETRRYSKYISIPELQEGIHRYYEMIFE